MEYFDVNQFMSLTVRIKHCIRTHKAIIDEAVTPSICNFCNLFG